MDELFKKTINLKAKLFRGFADPSRLAILEALRAKPMTVTEIITATGLNQSNASNHLGCLKDCGLVEVEQKGKFACYRLNGNRVEEILSQTSDLLAEIGRGFYECSRYTTGEEQDEPA